MKRLSIILSAIFSAFIWFSFAAPSVLNHSYTVDWNDVRIFWTDNSNGWNVDINLFNPNTQDWLHFGTAKISDQVFTYTKQWDWEQKIWMIPDDWWDEIHITIPGANSKTENVTRTVIPAVPKTWPDGNVIWLIVATFLVFWWYIYIKRRADI